MGAQVEDEPIVLIFHQELGSRDETATLEELVEKILYYYPHGEALEGQLKLLNWCEALMGFALKFSQKNITCVEMKTIKYTFYQPEPSIWIVLGSPLVSNIASNRSFQAVAQRLYQLFTLFHGRIGRNLNLVRVEGAVESNGMELLSRIQIARTKIRKLERSAPQYDHSLVDQRAELETLLEHSPKPGLRRKLESFVPRFLNNIDFKRLHLFYDLDGFHPFPVDTLAFLSTQTVLNTLQHDLGHEFLDSAAIFFDGKCCETAPNQCRNSFVGHFVASNIDREIMLGLYRFLRLREQEMFTRERSVELDPLWAHGTRCLTESHHIWSHYDRCTTRTIVNETDPRSLHRMDSKSPSTPESECTAEGFITIDGGFIMASTSGAVDKIWSPQVFDSLSKTVVVYQMDRITVVALLNQIIHAVDFIDPGDETPRGEIELEEACIKLEQTFSQIGLRQLQNEIYDDFCVSIKKPNSLREFVYYNHASETLKLGGISSQASAGGKVRKENLLPVPCQHLCVALPKPILETMDRMHEKLSDQVSELYVKTKRGWVVGQVIDDHELYVILDRKLAGVDDIRGKF